MALVDAYSPCPCGSQQKYKWCCHKGEAAALRAERLIQNDQFDQGLRVVEEGLAKEPKNLWLLSQKSWILEQKGDLAGSREALERVTRLKPDHQGAWASRVSLALLKDGVAAGVDELQLALAACPEGGPTLVAAILMIGVSLARSGDTLAALAHLELGGAASPDCEELARGTYSEVLSDPSISMWVKNPYELHDAPEELREDQKKRFGEAMADSELGLWSRAAARFQLLASEGIAEAEVNEGFCRLWILDDAGGTAALRRGLARWGNSTEAVELEALAQFLAPVSEDDQLERVRMSWPLRNRDGLLEILEKRVADRTAVEMSSEPVDAGKPDGPEARSFALLSHAIPPADAALKAVDMPRIRYRVLVGADTVAIEAIDEGKLDRLRDDFLALAASTVPPAHPKIRTVGRVPKHVVSLRTEWVLPEGLSPSVQLRVRAEEDWRILSKVWPDTPNPSLRGRTPRQAARAGDAEVPLRAALLQYEYLEHVLDDFGEVNELRRELGVPLEPIPDPETVIVKTLHLGRLGLLPVDRLSDEQLLILHARARGVGMRWVAERACAALVDRKELMSSLSAASRFLVFAELAQSKVIHEKETEALEWIARGREDEPLAHRAENAPRWDFLELRIRVRSAAPEVWVAELAAILDRYRENQAASTTVLTNLIEMRLIKMVPHPDQPDQILLDSRGLSMLLERYGPRVVTSTGALGVSAAKPDIWPPEKSTGGGGSGGIWTPGSAPPSPPSGEGGDKPRLILPGR